MSTSTLIEACQDLTGAPNYAIIHCFGSIFFKITEYTLAGQCILASRVCARSLGLTQGQWLAYTSNCCELVLLDMPAYMAYMV